VDEAATAFNQSMHLDPCNGVTHFDVARYWNLSGMYGTSQRHIETAYKLSPTNLEIAQRWRRTHAVPLTAEQRLALLKTRLERETDLTPEQKDGIEAAIKGIETREKGGCELVSPITETKVPMVPIANGPTSSPMEMPAAGLDVQINGKRKRLEIDTGASGLLLSRSAAKSAGLVPELESKAGGIGDEGMANAFVTHVDDIRIGGMEFRNCMVGVLEKNSALEIDGLIGPDVFRDYIVTLDIPGRELRIGSLPARPDETAKTTSLETSNDDKGAVSIADSARDRYVAPEMKDWTPVFRYEHFLIFPTMIGNAPIKLFMMDTGASFTMISPTAAREVTHVSGGSDVRVRGISGEVKNVLVADNVSIAFAGVRQVNEGMTSFDSSVLTQSAGVEISGLLGFPMLRELVISIDYRDNLVKVVYDPKKGYHAH
jgi:predicted aspartyl protease